MLKAMKIGLWSIVAPRRSIAASPEGWRFWLALTAIAVVLDLAPRAIFSLGSGTLLQAVRGYSIWIAFPGALIFFLGLGALGIVISAYFALFNWSILRIFSRKVRLAGVFTASLICVLIASILAFLPDVIVAVAGLLTENPVEKMFDIVQSVTVALSGFYLVVMQAQLSNLGVGVTLWLGIVSSLVAIAAALGIAWIISHTLPDLDKIFAGAV